MRKLVERDAVSLFLLLESYIPMDTPPNIQIRRNMKGRLCIRHEATTFGRAWVVDFYSKDFYYTLVQPETHQTFKTPLSLISYLYRSLGLNYDKITKS
jgi:hypothetical protein